MGRPFSARRAAPLRQLEALLLPGSQPLDDAALAEIARHRQLEVLGFCGLQASDAGLAQLASLPRLRSLSITGPGIDDHTLEFIARLPNLRALSLDEARVTDRGLAALGSLGGLRSLCIRSARLTEAGLPALARLGRLNELNLQGNDIRRLDTVGPDWLPQLRRLELNQTPIPDAEVAAFLSSRPQCDVSHESEQAEIERLSNCLESGEDALFLLNLKPCGEQIELIRGAECVRSLACGPLTRDSDFAVVASLPNLAALELRSDPSPVALKTLAGSPKLRRLELILCRLDAAAAAALARLPLAELELNSVEVSPAAWGSIGRIERLRVLDLFETKIGDDQVRDLAGLTGLTSLSLYEANFDDADVARLDALVGLEKLSLPWSEVTDVGVERLAKAHRRLRKLDLLHTRVTAAGIAHLAQLADLADLTIDFRLVENGGVQALRRCSALRRLTLDTRDSPDLEDYSNWSAQEHALREAIPQLEIVDLQ